MGLTLIMRDVREFGEIELPAHPQLGIAVAQTLAHDYVRYHLRWGARSLYDYQDHLQYIISVIERVDGVDQLTEEEQTVLLHESVGFLTRFMDYTEELAAQGVNYLDLFPPSQPRQSNLALIY